MYFISKENLPTWNDTNIWNIYNYYIINIVIIHPQTFFGVVKKIALPPNPICFTWSPRSNTKLSKAKPRAPKSWLTVLMVSPSHGWFYLLGFVFVGLGFGFWCFFFLLVAFFFGCDEIMKDVFLRNEFRTKKLQNMTMTWVLFQHVGVYL